VIDVTLQDKEPLDGLERFLQRLQRPSGGDRNRHGFPSGPILTRSGKLQQSFTKRGAENHIERLESVAGGWELSVGSDSDVAGWHERGTSRMPARPISPLQDRAEQGITEAIQQMIQSIERAALR
jgi:phage gpG-like protein